MNRAFLVQEHVATCNWFWCGEPRLYSLWESCGRPTHPCEQVGEYCERHAQKQLEKRMKDDSIGEALSRGMHLATASGRRSFPYG